MTSDQAAVDDGSGSEDLRPSGNRRLTLATISRAILYLGVAWSVIPYGAVLDSDFFVASSLIAIAMLLSTFVGPKRQQSVALSRSIILLLSVTVAFIVLQSASFEGNPLAHPIWQMGKLVGGGGSISVEPSTTMRSLLSLLMPFVVFLAAVALHDDDATALQLWNRVGWFGALIAVFGIIRHLTFPQTLLFGEAAHYQDSLTSVFVNRNSAATFLGVALLVLSGMAVRSVSKAKSGKLLSHLPHPALSRSDTFTGLLFSLFAFAATLVALLMTLSRAGVASTFVAFALVVVWALARYGLRGAAPWKRSVAIIILACLALLTFSSMAARVALRLDVLGLDAGRWCTYEATWRAIGDNWILGTGFGTFRSIYPMYRSVDCLPSLTWDKAHNAYLEGLLGLGLLFPVLLIACTLIVGRSFLGGLLHRRRYHFAPIVGFAIFLLLILHSFVDFSIQIPGVAAYFSLAIAAATSISLGRTSSRR